MKLIVVTGMPGSGKEEFLSVARSMNIPFVRMGDVVREYHSKSGTSMDVGEFATSERNTLGFNIWAKRCMERMSGNVFLVDGCRSPEEIKSFKGLTDDVIVVAIHTSPKIRYERLLLRARSDAPSTVDEFNARDAREMGWGMSDVISLSDEMIVNNDTLKKFHRNAKKLLKAMI